MTPVQDRQLERQGKRMIAPALRMLVIAAIPGVPGVVLVVTGSAIALGAVLLAFTTLPLAVAVALLLSASVARWAARHKLFA